MARGSTFKIYFSSLLSMFALDVLLMVVNMFKLVYLRLISKGFRV